MNGENIAKPCHFEDIHDIIVDVFKDEISLVGHESFCSEEDFTLKNVNENVMDVLEMTGFSDILTIQNEN